MNGIDLYTLGFSLLSPHVILLMICGLLMGIIIGALPGLSAIMAVSILLPVTYGMDSTAGISMLLGVYCGANYGGSISATLINIPGTPSAIMTTLDAYPMAKKGKAGLAVGLATMASGLGGIFSVVVLATVSPLIAEIALKFTSLEMLSICIFGITIMALVSQGSTIKGLMAGVVGLLICCIGFDPVTAVSRFTFGSISLYSGIDFTAAMIGLFGLAEILLQAEKGLKKAGQYNLAKLEGPFECFKYLKAEAGNLIRSSVIGTLIGAIPGAGGTIASVVSYGVEQKTSKHPEEMGQGSPDGIVASEAANNACCGGAMTTLLSLGIPGDAVTAILLGAFIVHGVTPGPNMFTGNRELVSAIFIGMLIINVLILILGLLLAPSIAKLLKVSPILLDTCILILCVVGTFGVHNSMFDVEMMVLFGVIGFLFVKLGIPRAPMVLALVLGSLFESNLRRCVSIANGDFWGYFVQRSQQNPIALIVLLITVISLFFPIISRAVKARAAGKKST